MNSRGFSLVEVLVAVVAASLVLLGISAFYLNTLTVSTDTESQAFLQRQGTLIMEEFGRQIRSADSLTIVNAATPPGTCMDAITDLSTGTDALAVDNGNTYCFYRNTADHLIRCEFEAGVCNSWNLLSGSPAVLTLADTPASFVVGLVTPCATAGGSCTGTPSVCSNPSYSCAISPAAIISFTIRYTPRDRTNEHLDLTFVDTLTTSRHQ